MGVLVFGTGRLYSKFRWLLVQADVLAFLDNAVEKQGKIIDGCAVLSPEKVQELEYEAVILCSVAIDKMRQQLLALGVLDEKIVPYQMIRDFVRRELSNVTFKVFGSFMVDDEKEKRAALFFNEIGRSGAPIALLEAARILCKQGWKVTAYAEHDGDGAVARHHARVLLLRAVPGHDVGPGRDSPQEVEALQEIPQGNVVQGGVVGAYHAGRVGCVLHVQRPDPRTRDGSYQWIGNK